MKWYYNSHFKKCIQFHYSGIGGNANNFDSCEECFNRCYLVIRFFLFILCYFIKIFKRICQLLAKPNYQSKNPYNRKGSFLMGLLRSNSNISDSKLEKFKRMPNFDSLEIGTLNKFNQSVCITI